MILGVVAATFLLLGFAGTCLSVQAQEVLVFTPADQFSLPQSNGSINFARSGNCTQAALEGAAWVFTNLNVK